MAARKQNRSITGLSTAAADLLFSYPWPGNLRELNRVIHVAVALTAGDVIGPEAVILNGGPPAAPVAKARIESPVSGDEARLTAVERRHIRRVLEKLGGNKAQAAKALGISRSTLDRKLAAHRLASE